MRELCELLENITEEGYTVLFGQYDGSDELYIRIFKKGASIQYPLCKYYLREQKTTRLQNICNPDSDYTQFVEEV